MKTKKSIKRALVAFFSISTAIIIFVSFTITYMLVQNTLSSVKTNSIERLVEDSSVNISNQIDTMFATAYTIASDEDVHNPAISYEDKKPKLLKYAAERSINSIGYISAEGYLISTDGFENDISSRDYFINLMKGGKYISNPSFNTATNSQIIFIGVPLYNNGTIVGAITLTFDSSYMSNIINNVSFNGDGQAFMISSDGTAIASNNMDDVLNKLNYIEAAKEDPSLQAEAELTEVMLASQSGFTTLRENLYFYTKVDNSEGWTLFFILPKKSFQSEISSMMVLFVICGIIAIGIVVVISFLIGTNLGSRLNILQKHIEDIADGRFDIKLNEKELNNTDEIGLIYNALNKTLTDVGNAISSIKTYSSELADGVLTLENTSNTLSNGTDAVSQSMHEIQTGNSEQAREIENINIEMTKFNTNVEDANTNIEEVMETTVNATKKLSSSNEEMEKLKASFSKFNEFFAGFVDEIQKMNDNLSSVSMITSTISDIAEETNLLSLNASIEAARAGEAGKGFSVVAQEIAKLAQQSADSVNEISNVVNIITTSSNNLIEKSNVMGGQVTSQGEIIDETLSSFEFLTNEMNEILPAIKNISHISNENLNMARTIGDSISNANAISEELVATTSEVNQTTKGFLDSSKNVSEASKMLNDLSENLNNISSKFTC